MNSFLRKLKREGVVKQEEAEQALPVAQTSKVGMVPPGVAQLPIDVYQTDAHIVVYAQIPGLDISNLDISIEGDNDVVTIQGEYKRPEGIHADVGSDGSGEFSLEECSWGQFFRQIILPQEIEAEAADAKVKDGVLIMKFPLKGAASKKFKMRVVKIGDMHEARPEGAMTVAV